MDGLDTRGLVFATGLAAGPTTALAAALTPVLVESPAAGLAGDAVFTRADFAEVKGCATAVIGFSVGLLASVLSLACFCELSGIGLKAGPAALAIVLVVLSVQRKP